MSDKDAPEAPLEERLQDFDEGGHGHFKAVIVHRSPELIDLKKRVGLYARVGGRRIRRAEPKYQDIGEQTTVYTWVPGTYDR